ncbi:arsenical pump-driving ATPase [Paucibacter sp. DJ1R-11]|uniref:arsenical pump-driving ATPase n=1 Tax=Paucibacter sp. DJ1R-11 TaxID=2893556 RepID=UPI0021E4E361|nr:arsenical pump-driving ATPase [Paucibacter sp. DJ1R-11]MCV2364871.1 arsenical pump-driving ATPase [Paucibacter sp. DJ1R-11]
MDISNTPRFQFFTGKGGVGKTSCSTATALALADAGQRVLLVSTDAASNLDEMLAIPLRQQPVNVPGAPGLSVMNIDPNQAAEDYRQRVLAQLGAGASAAEQGTVREQLSGACTTEIAAFDEFASLLAEGAPGYDHIVFDTAPTGHTLRLLSLPKAWSGFLADNDRGASCLGPHSGLKMQEARFQAALAALCDPALTEVVLVARPERGALDEAARSAVELQSLGLKRQRLLVNGVFHASVSDDPVAAALEAQGQAALAAMPAALAALPRRELPLRPMDMVGLAALRALFQDPSATLPAQALGASALAAPDEAARLSALCDELAAAGRGLILVMGKGGVGKTTIAAALAIGLVRRGHAVHLSTTDPAAHVLPTLQGEVPGLRVDAIDPKRETEAYIAKVMAHKGRDLDEAGRALLLEDLQSPCTEEVAVFHAFSRVVSEARSAFVVLDTAPTGHSLLLMDATGAYDRQMRRELQGGGGGGGGASARLITPLMRLQDPAYTRILLVTLAEQTPVSQAAALQSDLRRAGIEPFAWIMNRSLLAAGAHDPLLSARLAGEQKQMQRIADEHLAQHLFWLPWCAVPPVGIPALAALAR